MLHCEIPYRPSSRNICLQIVLRLIMGLAFGMEWLSVDALQNGRASDLSSCIYEVVKNAKRARDGRTKGGFRSSILLGDSLAHKKHWIDWRGYLQAQSYYQEYTNC